MYAVYWLIASAVFLLVEIMTLGLTSIWFAGGAVVAAIAALAATEIDGVYSMAGNITNELIGKLGMKNLSKGVKVTVLEGVVTVDLNLNIEYGKNILETSKKVQEKVKSSIENMTGLEVADVNIRIAGVDMENEKDK